MLDFPCNPNVDDEYAGFVWDGEKWVKKGGGGAAVTISPTPPVDPSEGDLWWDSAIGGLMVWSGAQWVEACGGGGGSKQGVTDGSNAAAGEIGEWIEETTFDSITVSLAPP
jgi:hypothetical protein